MLSKCCNTEVFLEKKGNSTGVYCSKCGKWQKWANKDDIRVISLNNKTNNKDKNKCDHEKEISDLISQIDKEIDNEFSRFPNSKEDVIRRSAKCTAMEMIKVKLEDMLN